MNMVKKIIYDESIDFNNSLFKLRLCIYGNSKRNEMLYPYDLPLISVEDKLTYNLYDDLVIYDLSLNDFISQFHRKLLLLWIEKDIELKRIDLSLQMKILEYMYSGYSFSMKGMNVV